MSGHSKWSTIKRKKGAADARRGKIFTKIAREIMVAARDGGDPVFNPRLRAALAAAKAANMPRDNQERAIKKGTGDLDGVTFEEVQYEGRGPHNSCFIVQVLTDNRNRTVAELRHILGKAGGELVANGAVAWQFDARGVVEVEREAIGEVELLEKVMAAGAEDIKDWGESWGVLCAPGDLQAVADALAELDATGELRWLVKRGSGLSLSGDEAIVVARLWAALDEHDDVQGCFCNASLPDDIMDEHGP